jgi:hypothetical protein
MRRSGAPRVALPRGNCKAESRGGSLKHLAGRLEQALLALIRVARPDRSRYVARLAALIQKHGGVAAVRQVLAEPPPGDPEPSLSVEMLVLDPEWGCLFTEEERTLARERLQRMGPPGKLASRARSLHATKSPTIQSCPDDGAVPISRQPDASMDAERPSTDTDRSPRGSGDLPEAPKAGP